MSIEKIQKRIMRKRRGSVFTPAQFLDCGSRANVDQALARLAKKGVIRRLARGVYDYPKIDPQLGMLTPNPDVIAKAITDGPLLISSARAANLFGLTTQVPAQAVYLTDGTTRTRKIGRRTIRFRNASAKTLAGADRMSGIVFQALRYLGKDGVTTSALDKISKALNDGDKKNLTTDSLKAPAWMRDPVQYIAAR